MERDLGKLPQHLARFAGNSPDKAKAAIDSVLANTPEATPAQIFKIVSEGKGRGKSHVSQFQQPQYDGTLKRS